MNELDFRLILERFDLSPEGYRKVRKGVQKRIVRHMAAVGCPTAADYLKRLDGDAKWHNEARRHMDVSIGRFFRDGPLWQILEKEIFPPLSLSTPAGCGSGRPDVPWGRRSSAS